MGVCHDQEIDDPALDVLPCADRLGLLLQALGADDELIADCLDIDPAGVVTLLDIGARSSSTPSRPPMLQTPPTRPTRRFPGGSVNYFQGGEIETRTAHLHRTCVSTST